MAALNWGVRATVDSLQGKLKCIENELWEYQLMQDKKLQALIDSNEKLAQAIFCLTNHFNHHGGNGGILSSKPNL
jgi:hypothetical protein